MPRTTSRRSTCLTHACRSGSRARRRRRHRRGRHRHRRRDWSSPSRLLVLGMGHRTGKRRRCSAAAPPSPSASPACPAGPRCPSGVATGSLIIAVFGMYWDISLHIDVGRDEGPLANPAHYFILARPVRHLRRRLPRDGAAQGAARARPRSASPRDWYAPLGGVLICACGAFSLTGFPLDDVWHRLFGQDVTLWGPTHLMLIGGASMTLVGIAVLLVEGLRANAAAGSADRETHAARAWARAVALTGGFLLGLSTFQAEFDFGVPQFRFVFQPMLIMLAAGVGLVAARMLGAAAAPRSAPSLFFLVIRGMPVADRRPGARRDRRRTSRSTSSRRSSSSSIALRVAATTARWRSASWSGLGIGTVGLAAEWALVARLDADPVAARAAARGRAPRLRDAPSPASLARRLDRRAPGVEPTPRTRRRCAARPCSARPSVAALRRLRALQARRRGRARRRRR